MNKLTVIVNSHRQTALLCKQGSKYKHCVLMDSAGLSSHRFTDAEFRYEGWHEIEYDPVVAERKFLAAGKNFGITNAAHRLLTGC